MAQSAGWPPQFTCEEAVTDCGTYYIADELTVLQLPDCHYVDDELDCSALEAANQAVVDCVLAADSFIARRVEYVAVVESYRRTLVTDGDVSLDFLVLSLDLWNEWTAMSVLTPPDLSSCAAQPDATAGWTCIEAQFDAASELGTCGDPGGYEEG